MDENIPQSLVIGNDVAELARVGVWVNAWSSSRNLPASLVKRLDLCAAEAVTNIVAHGYSDDSSHQIGLHLQCNDRLVSLEIEDDGCEFDPAQVAEPGRGVTLENARIGGLGVHIVRNFSDEVQRRRSSGRNHLTLKFKLPQS